MAALLTAAACGPSRRGAPGALPAGARVPAVAPTAIPDDVYDRRRYVVNDAELGSIPFLPDLVIVSFRARTPRASRQRAVDLVRGVVAGGVRLYADGDGWYLVRVPGDSTGAGVFRATRALRVLPQVEFAEPVTIIGSAAWRPVPARPPR